MKQLFITKENLKKAVEKTGVEVSDRDVENMMAELQLNNPNKLDFKEFCKVLDCKIHIASGELIIQPPKGLA